jgi:hypothetical protein
MTTLLPLPPNGGFTAELAQNLTLDELEALYERLQNGERPHDRGDIPIDPARRKAYAKQGLVQFAQVYFPHYLDLPSAKFHYELAQIALDVALGRGEYANYRGFVAAAARDHAKSSYVSLFLVVYCCVFQLKHFIILISDTDDPQAKTIAANIKTEFEENTLLREDFGDMRGVAYGFSWTVQDFDVVIAEDGVILHRIRVLSRGVGSRLRGLRERSHRPDLVIGDDMENDDNIETELQRQKIWLWFNKTLMPMIDRRVGRVIIIGTVIHNGGLLRRLLSLAETDGSEFVGRIWNAISKDGEVLWPERYSAQDLAQIKARNPFAFNTEYMNDPIDELTRVIRAEWIQWYTTDDIDYDPTTHLWYFRGKVLQIDGFMDPNLTEREKGDESALVVGGHPRDKSALVILYCWADRVDFPATVDTCLQVADYWRIRSLGIEANHYQRALSDQVKLEMRKRVRVTPRRSEGRKFDRIKGASPVFAKGRVYLRAAKDDEEGEWDELQRVRVHHTQVKYYHNLIYYPNDDHDDYVDATERLIDMAGGVAAFAPNSWF